MIAVGEVGAHGHRTGDRIDARIDGADLTLEGAARPRHAGGADLVTDAQRSQFHFRHLEIDVHVLDVIERGDDRGRGHQRAGADLADAEHASERRAHAAVTDVGLHLHHARLGGITDRLLRIQRGAGHQPLGGQLARAPVQLVGFVEGGLRLHQRGLLGLPAQGHDRRTGGHMLATFKVHLLDDFADLGRHADGLARLGRAQRLQRVIPLRGLHDLRGHRHRFALPTGGGLLFAPAPGQKGQAEAKGQGRSNASQHERS